MEDDANTLRGVLEFDGKEVRDLIAHAVSCDRFQITFEERIEIYGEGKWEPQTGEETAITAALTLVKDQGIYLMSNGRPGLADQGKTVPGRKLNDKEEKTIKSGEFTHKVAYARGFEPSQESFEWYDRARATVGGDDCATRIEINATEEGLCRNEGRVLMIAVYESHYDIGYTVPMEQTAAHTGNGSRHATH